MRRVERSRLRIGGSYVNARDDDSVRFDPFVVLTIDGDEVTRLWVVDMCVEQIHSDQLTASYESFEDERQY